MANFTDEQINNVWDKGIVQENNDPQQFRKDIVGAWIKRESYGKEEPYGWEIDHVYPESKGGDDNLLNLRPMQWQNNRSKSDDYPEYNSKITSEGNKNIEKEQRYTVHEEIQKQLLVLYHIY
jgi:hypothetical protein